MPPFSEPFGADWLLPIIKLPLMLASGVLWVIEKVGPIGQILLVLIFMALFARNLLQPPYENPR
jgi:hypothetical protein